MMTGILAAQQPYLTHSHNDYRQAVPFWHAYSNGAASIEVDLFLQNDTLFVTHDEADVEPTRTFGRLYLDPINRLAEAEELRPIQLLIDLKSAAYPSIDRVVAALEQYPTLTKSEHITFVVSGNRPAPEDYNNYPNFIYFDHQHLLDLADTDLRKVAMISQNFRAYSRWNGYGRMTAQDSTRVSDAIQRARTTGIPFRFWATPDTKTAWACFAKLGLGYVNTDKPALAHQFLDRLDHNTYSPEPALATYTPRYAFDEQARLRNIVLMIGDGNGLAQISAALLANRGELSLTKIKHVGLVGTAAADDVVTDSAAAGTAIATGVKTDNRAIGVDPAGRPLPTLVELLGAEGYNTAIITTDAIDGATPSAFYAHTSERDDADKIIADLLASDVDLFIAGKKLNATEIEAKFTTKTLDQLTDLDQPTAIYRGEGKMPTVVDGRGDFLPRSVAKALQILYEEDKPFFLLVEGAQIDNGGHANDITTTVTEMLDFDQAVGEALRFADTDRETLVVVTADHETGGLGIAGSVGLGTVRADFLSVDHSGVLVPLFAYGPQAQRFMGVFENTEIFARLLGALSVGD